MVQLSYETAVAFLAQRADIREATLRKLSPETIQSMAQSALARGILPHAQAITSNPVRLLA